MMLAWLQAIHGYSRAACKCHGVSGSCSTRTCWNQLPAFREVGVRLRRRYGAARQVALNAHGTSLYPALSVKTTSTATKKKKRRKNSSDGQQRRRQRVGRRPRRRRRPTKDDLVYLDPSPDYCEPDSATPGAVRTGSAGTRGRRCRRGSRGGGGGPDSCDRLCCGRGHDTALRHVVERCHCQFRWCCRVECTTCLRTESIHTCK